MSAILDSLTVVVGLSAVAWIVVMCGTGAALAHRLGWRAVYGALLGLLPVPFLGWVIVLVRWHRSVAPSALIAVDMGLRPAVQSAVVVDDWSRP